MIDALLVEDLANAPSQDWARLIEIAEVLGRFDGAQVSGPTADEGAAELGVTRRQFYRLLAAHRRRRAGATPKKSMTGLHFAIADEKEEAIADALASVGPGARLFEVYREALRLSQERGFEPPSRTSVRTRLGKGPAAIDLRRTLRTKSDFVVDLCALELNLISFGGSARGPAHFLAFVEVSTSQILHHRLYIDRPHTRDIALAAEEFLAESALPSGSSRRLGYTVGIAKILAQATTSEGPGPAASANERVPSGAAIKAVFGNRVGRVIIRRDVKSVEKCTSFRPVSVLAASRVIRYLVDQRNSLAEPVASKVQLTPTGFSLASSHPSQHRGEEACEILNQSI